MMANRFWVGNGGNWSDAANHWSASTGGAPNASLPTSADNVYFDANSFSAGGQTVTIGAIANCLDMDWTGATNTPILTMGGAGTLYMYGQVTMILDMVFTPNVNRYFFFNGSSATCSLTTNGLTIATNIGTEAGFTGTLTLVDDLTCSYSFYHQGGTIDTNGQTIACGAFSLISANAKTLTLGSSVINCTAWTYSGSNLTVTANTATIKVSGTGVFAGGGITTYYEVQLNGTAHTISGDNTFTALILPSGTTQTITLTAGSIQTIGTATLDGDATHAHTIKSGTTGTLASLIATTVTETYVTYTDIRRSWSTLKVGEVIVYNRKLSFTETENIRLATKWRYA